MLKFGWYDRKDVLDVVSGYVPSDYIGLVRKPNVINMSEWTPILRYTYLCIVVIIGVHF